VRRVSHPSETVLRRGESLLRPDPEASRRRMRLVEWRPLVKGSLRGFASVELPSGLQIIDCPVFAGNKGRSWAGLPSKPQLDRDGIQRFVDGKPAYTPVLAWCDKALRDRWSDAVVALVRQAHPEAFDGGGQP
jgi:hypothetical protein